MGKAMLYLTCPIQYGHSKRCVKRRLMHDNVVQRRTSLILHNTARSKSTRQGSILHNLVIIDYKTTGRECG